MVICGDPAFVFVHIPKTAGTTITGALVSYDPIRMIRRLPHDKEAREAYLHKHALPEDVAGLSIHCTALQIIDFWGRERFDSAYSFAFVRNPWDLELSWFYFCLQNADSAHHHIVTKYSSFSDYIRRYSERHDSLLMPGPQARYVTDEDGRIIVDKVGRFETLEDDFAEIVDTLGLEGVVVDHFNQSYHKPWTEEYDPETFAIVARYCELDCDLFGYDKDPAAYGIG